MTMLNDEEWSMWSDREIARRCAVGHVTVIKYRKEISGENHQMERKVQRNGTVYTQNTAKICKRFTDNRTQGRAQRHGKRRTNADKRKAVMTMLNDEEWCKWSDREIAEKCCVSNRFVSNVRPTSVTANGSQLSERTYTTKHGTVATMNTSNIGKRGYQAPDVNEKLVIVHTPGNCIA